MGLAYDQPLDPQGGPTEAGRIRGRSADIALTLRYEPAEGWFATITGYHYLDASRRRSWNGDYSYAFGYDDWRPKTFSLVYSNYGANRFTPDLGQPATDFMRGTISGSYKFNLPGRIAEPFLIDRTQTIGCRVGYNITPRYTRVDGSTGSQKHSVSFGCRTPIWRRLFVDWTLYDYVRGQQQPWDPDITYSFGWFDWRSHHLSLQYSNYAGNRLPGRGGPPNTGGFKAGVVTLSWAQSF